eukprot:TRINITY_DN2166_c0_g1_i11.p1 TRINITY_DN2166_c0_g1~~TRINITY_DN2166_c0_g1_i11.p1  ORF type:complete len:414 (-),score=73.58 TRINITY_DN2166_c0_g1_i11:37-1278(-)
MEHLADDLLSYIFGFLDPTSVGRAAQVSKNWHAAALDELLWASLCYNVFSITIPDDQLHLSRNVFIVWYSPAFDAFLRIRPSSLKELSSAEGNCCVELESEQQADIELDGTRRTMAFQRCFGPLSAQDEVAHSVIDPLVLAAFHGRSGCVVSYGQTGSGKSHTMFSATHSHMSQGLMHYTLQRIFSMMFEQTEQFDVQMAMFEIYNERIADLSCHFSEHHTELRVRETADSNGPYVESLTWNTITSAEEGLLLLQNAHKHHTIWTCHMGTTGSRSNVLMHVRLVRAGTVTAELMLVKMNGSERTRKFVTTESRLEEARCIGMSLSSIGNVISALASGARHVPYRDSKLTRVLSKFMDNEAMCRFICHVTPFAPDACESLSTMRYGHRVRTIPDKRERPVRKPTVVSSVSKSSV